jgi:hypothetical protein
VEAPPGVAPVGVAAFWSRPNLRGVAGGSTALDVLGLFEGARIFVFFAGAVLPERVPSPGLRFATVARFAFFTSTPFCFESPAFPAFALCFLRAGASASESDEASESESKESESELDSSSSSCGMVYLAPSRPVGSAAFLISSASKIVH